MNYTHVKVVEMQSVSPEAALTMVTHGIKKAMELGCKKGHIVIYGREQFPLASASLGPVTRSNTLVANAKARTVLNSTRDTHHQAEYMRHEEIDPNDYAGGIETKFGGGLTIFADDDCQVWVGSVAFSGGSEDEDIEVCRAAAQGANLFTRLG